MEQKIYSALAKFAKDCKGISKDSENSFFKKPDGTKSKYASLSAIQTGIKEPLEKAGLILVHSVQVDAVTTTVYADDGSFVSSTFPFILGKPQENGSAVTYAKRYNTAALLNLDTDADDDGNEAQKTEKVSTAKPVTKPAQAPAAGAKWFNHTKFKSTEDSPEWEQLIKDITAQKFPSAEDYIMDIKTRGFKIYGPVEQEIRDLYSDLSF
jgi:hypothetical protein